MSQLSIISVNYNNAEGLKRTLDSVASQTYQEFEHIIIDAASTDGSMDVIHEYEQQLHIAHSTIHLFWSSEKDKGIYDGMNKGIKKATGEYLYFLNSGDVFAADDVVAQIVDLLDGSDIIVGRVNRGANGRIYGQTALVNEQDLSLYNMYLHGINHQSAIVHRSIQSDHLYDATLKIGADWKFFVETIVLGGAKVKFVDKIFANYDVSGVSSNTAQLRLERKKIMLDILPERIARDYLTIAPYYYEVKRVKWLLEHPFWYKLYRGMTTFGRKLMS